MSRYLRSAARVDSLLKSARRPVTIRAQEITPRADRSSFANGSSATRAVTQGRRFTLATRHFATTSAINRSTDRSEGKAGSKLEFSDADLEEEVRKKFLKDCDLDAAIDIFLWNVRNNPGSEPKLLDQYHYKAQTQKKFQDQLIADLGFKGTFKELLGIHEARIEKRRAHIECLAMKTEKPPKFYIEATKALRGGLNLSHADKGYANQASPLKQATTHHAKELIDSIAGQKEKTMFACGGAIKGQRVSIAFRTPKQFSGDHETDNMRLIEFPIEGDEKLGLSGLIQQCSPAGFGVGNREVMDPEYRDALKLDPNAFLTNFNPYNLGIIDTIRQILLPDIYPGLDETLPITAELYKLNIYAGPSGKFRPHVDTPRSDAQFGSLVVCLPCAHSGGQLEVRHDGRRVKFDWNGTNQKDIQWAAFFSDCEHEVFQVTAGHRCTLTYNLYLDSDKLPGRAPKAPLFSIESTPLVSQVQDLLQKPEFMPQGGVIGYYCNHLYAHANKFAVEGQPATLKGIDAAVYSVLSHFRGVSASLIPVSTIEIDETGAGAKEKSENAAQALLGYQKGSDSAGKTQTEKQTGPPLQYFENEYHLDEDELGSVEKRKAGLQQRRRIAGYRTDQRPYSWIVVQSNFRPVFEGVAHYESDSDEQRLTTLPLWVLPHAENILWLNKETDESHAELSIVQATYGNEAGLDYIYSRAAILATIPPYSQDRGSGKK